MLIFAMTVEYIGTLEVNQMSEVRVSVTGKWLPIASHVQTVLKCWRHVRFVYRAVMHCQQTLHGTSCLLLVLHSTLYAK
jgi:hypothetical protein